MQQNKYPQKQRTRGTSEELAGLLKHFHYLFVLVDGKLNAIYLAELVSHPYKLERVLAIIFTGTCLSHSALIEG